MAILDKILGDPNQKYLRRIQPLVDKINELEPAFEKLSDADLKEKTLELKSHLLKGKTLDELLPEAFALVRESAKRTLGQRHFDVQIIGGIVLHQGKIAEMLTGEGKTLTATLALYLNGLEGKGCHLVTVNDYLAKRDTVWMGQIYYALGMSVGCITHEAAYIYTPAYQPENSKSEILNPKPKIPEQSSLGGRQIQNPKFKIQNDKRDEERDAVGGFKVIESYLKPVSRKEAYEADITYGTNNEFGFDYLRDNMVYDLNQRVQVRQRDAKQGGETDAESYLNYAIIDEVDSILIDEARTPLIISRPDTESSKRYQDFAKIIPRLQAEIDYVVDEKLKAVSLTEQGITKIEKILGVENLYAQKGMHYLHYLEQSLRAEVLFKRDRDYIVKDGQVIIVDEFTGRLMPGRRWSGGLHQALEAKEGVPVQAESLTLASITFQNYFRQYKKLAGMTGTARTSAEEFDKVYNLEVISVPPNKPMIRKDFPDKVFKSEQGKFSAILQFIKEKNKYGQPVLVGTTSIAKNEYLSQLLTREGISHNVLNAKHHEREGEIIAQAGRLGAVTVATNMAGRGVDIILGGNPPDLAEAKKIKELGGLCVIGTERHEARRIDNQLRGRAGRQGDPGESHFFVSLEDDLMRIFGGERIKQLMERFHFPEDQPIESKLVSRAIEEAQSKIEGMNLDLRKHLLDYDEVLNKQRQVFYRKRREILEKSPAKLREFVLDVIKRRGERVSDYLQKEKELGPENMRQIERLLLLRILDFLWIDHLTELEYLRDSVRLRAYGQQDPLVEYKRESHFAFSQLMTLFEKQFAETILKVQIIKEPSIMEEARFTHPLAPSFASLSSSSALPGQAVARKKVGRNDPCPCGKINPQTGKPLKYKKCCYPKFG